MLSGLYKYHGASCGLCEEEAVSPLGRGSSSLRVQAVCGLGGRDGGHTVPEPPSSPAGLAAPIQPRGRARPGCSTLDWPYSSISRKQHLGKPWGLSGSRGTGRRVSIQELTARFCWGLSQPVSD